MIEKGGRAVRLSGGPTDPVSPVPAEVYSVTRAVRVDEEQVPQVIPIHNLTEDDPLCPLDGPRSQAQSGDSVVARVREVGEPGPGDAAAVDAHFERVEASAGVAAD